jgi:nitroimidazol reductase NimA-like FMN-containing flavoprotein (pyridoxamine 5'-phosphate oxidase superfamily)
MINDEIIPERRHEGAGSPPRATEPLRERIERLVRSQPYGVLCTQGEGQPYASLVAFAFSGDLSTAVFATPVATRKYRLLSECERVALLVDNRPQHVDDMMQVEAVTATGRAAEIRAGADRERLAAMLIGRHPYLKSFVSADSSALFEIEITRFFHVTRFQEVTQWVPARR